eukprot:g78948.t1
MKRDSIHSKNMTFSVKSKIAQYTREDTDRRVKRSLWSVLELLMIILCQRTVAGVSAVAPKARKKAEKGVNSRFLTSHKQYH